MNLMHKFLFYNKCIVRAKSALEFGIILAMIVLTVMIYDNRYVFWCFAGRASQDNLSI